MKIKVPGTVSDLVPLMVIDYISLPVAFFMVISSILAVTFLIVLPMKEPYVAFETIWRGSRLKTAVYEVKDFGQTAFKAFTGTRAAFVGVLFALLPAGAYALSLALMANVAVEIGMTDTGIAKIGLVSTICAAAGCVAGGFISDKVGRRKSLAVYLLLTTLPTMYFDYMMYHYGWIEPVLVTGDTRPGCSFGLLCIALLPLMKPVNKQATDIE